MATPWIKPFPNIFSPTAAPPTPQTSNFFGSTAQPGFGLPMEPVRVPASNVDDPAPSPQLMLKFAEALAHWTHTRADVSVASHLELLATYEQIIDCEIGRSGNEDERKLLRGERSSWRLLSKIYKYYEQKDVGSWEQYPPQDPPLRCADWGAELRELGEPLPPLDQSHARDRCRARDRWRALDQSHDDGFDLSLAPARAGLRVRALHDERLLEEGLIQAEPQLELAEQLKQWLEEEAIERVVEKTITFRHTKQPHREELHAAGQPVSHLPSSLDPDAPFKEKKQLDPEDDAAEAELLRLLWQRVRAGKLDEAQKLCRKCGQHWRAATLAGGELYHYDASELRWRGNPDRDLWKSACEKIAQRAAHHRERSGATHEAALYAALAASRESHELVTKACEGWEDKLWAALNTARSTYLSQQMKVLSARASGLLPPAAPDPKLQHNFQRDAYEVQLADAKEPHHKLQHKLIALRSHLLPLALVPMDDGRGVFGPNEGPNERSARRPRAAAEPATTQYDSIETALAELLRCMHDLASTESFGQAHLRRFSAHASIFVYLPLLGQPSLPKLDEWRQVLTKSLSALIAC